VLTEVMDDTRRAQRSIETMAKKGLARPGAMSAYDPKQTWAIALQMSAFGPKRTVQARYRGGYRSGENSQRCGSK